LQNNKGGIDELMKGAGKDATRIINKEHAWVNVHAMLSKCLIGGIVDE
jgi:cytochrome-b5 reductase